MMGSNAGLAALERYGVAELRREWARLHGRAPPAGLGRNLLIRGIAWQMQAQVHGGFPPALKRELARLAAQLDRSGELDLERQMSLKVGTRLVRQWHGRTCSVTVLEDGFLFEERRYASLSQIARAITGANWSGPRFFGLRQRTRTEASLPELNDA